MSATWATDELRRGRPLPGLLLRLVDRVGAILRMLDEGDAGSPRLEDVIWHCAPEAVAIPFFNDAVRARDRSNETTRPEG